MSRIIAGRLASRRLATVPGTATRPTTDRVRESVFAFLAARLGTAGDDPARQLAGLRFLDLYGGSGAVGLEAASRGATVTWVEKQPAALAVIRANVAALGVTGTVVGADVHRFAQGTPRPYDIAWLDPPYDTPSGDLTRLIGVLDDRGWLAPGALVLVERAARASALEFPFSVLNVGERRSGDTVVVVGEKG